MRHPDLTRLRHIMYDEAGTKRLHPDSFKYLSPLALALWYQDDGSYTEQPSISTYTFPKEEQEALCEYLERRYGIHGIALQYHKPRTTTWGLTGNHWTLRFRNEAWQRFREIIEPHIHPSMLYKIGIN